MDCNSSDITKMNDSRTPTLRQIKTSEKQTEAEEGGAQQVWDSYDKLTTKQRPLSPPGLPLEKKMDHEKRRGHILINEHNRLTFAVTDREAKMKELQESLKAETVEPTNDYNEACKQRIRQLENNQDKMKIKIIEAKEIQTAYQSIREHLQQEVRDMNKDLDQKEHAITVGQAEVDRATKQFQSAAAAADGTLGRMVQMEDETMMRNREMDIELGQLSAEEKELKRQMGTLEHVSPTGPSRQKEPEIEEEEEEEEEEEDEEEEEVEVEEEAHSVPVTDHQCYDVCGASQSDVKLVEDMEALTEALSDAEVQELVNKAVLQRAAKEQLRADVTQYEDGTRQGAKALADLELQYAQLKFSAKPASTRFDKLKGEMQAKLNQDVVRVERLQAELKRSQDLLDTVERGVSSLYFKMSRVPVEGLSSAPSPDSTDRLRDVRARVPTLLQRASEQTLELSGPDQEMVYSLHEELNRLESGNVKRRTSPIHVLTESLTDTPQLSDEEEEQEEEEECSLSREEMKRCSGRLIESEQDKSSRATRKQ